MRPWRALCESVSSTTCEKQLTELFLAVMHAVSEKYPFELEKILEGLRMCIEKSLGSKARSLSESNPIDKVVTDSADGAACTVSCMIEACSGSGKSLCAADYFVRNPKTSRYCLFGYTQEQELYLQVDSISQLINVAIDLDLQACDQKLAFDKPDECKVNVLDIDILESSWNILGALGYLFGKTETVAKVTLQHAKKWTKDKDLWLLVDEAIPGYQDTTDLVNPIARLVFFKRILRNAGFNTIMLGTNTLVMNFNKALRQTDNSRGRNPEHLVCITHRALPPMILQSEKQHALLRSLFGEEQCSLFLDNVNPWLCNQMLKGFKGATEEIKDRADLFRDLAGPVLAERRKEKKNLSDASLYCMFQIATHDAISQAHIMQGFGLLNIWPQGEVPARGSPGSIIDLDRRDDKIYMMNTDIHNISCRFPPAWADPITTGICAGGGRPFRNLASALEVLRRIHQDTVKPREDPTAVDAMRRDGNVLESFGAVVLMLTSWAKPEDILSTLSYHCGREVKSTVTQVLAAVDDKEAAEQFRQVLTRCLCNLIPLRDDESNMLDGEVFGYYIRCMDKRERDGCFSGPVFGPDRRRMKGAAEFKNWRVSVNSSDLKGFVEKLSKNGEDLLLFMAPAFGDFKYEWILPRLGDSDWLVLHWTIDGAHLDWRTFHHVVQDGEKRYRILVLMEVGLSTKPFCEPSMRQDQIDA